MSCLLRLDSITAGYSTGHPVLRDVSIEVSSGEFIALVGPNGSGKSTLVRAASRSLKPAMGRALLEGRDIWSYSAREFARQVAVVPQETAVPFDVSAIDIVLLGRHPHVGPLHLESREDRTLAEDALASVAAAHLAGRSVRQISGGERQRVVIAKALAQEPRLLILDEPTSHLDVTHQAEILSLISRLTIERGIAVLAVLHDLNLAAAWSARIAVMHGGTIAADGPPAEVITESLLARVWQARMWVRKHPATGRPFLLPMPPVSQTAQAGGKLSPSIHVICGGGSGGPIIHALMNAGYAVTCGVLNVGDSDEELCRMMNIPHVAEAPFSPISRDSSDENLKLSLAADVVVLTDFCVGPGNLDNILVAQKAADAGKRLILAGVRDPQSQDFAGGRAAEALQRLQADSEWAAHAGDLLALLEAGRDRKNC